ncbi:MAG: alanine racemase [Micavibrio sp.]
MTLAPANLSSDPLSARSAASGHLVVDLKALAENYTTLCRTMTAGKMTASVVKADAYGLGMKEAASLLATQGCHHFFVATTQEALDLRVLLPEAEIYVLCTALTQAGHDYIVHNIYPVLNNLHDLALWRQYARQHDRSLPAALHFDTGMNRLGFEEAEARDLIADPALMSGTDIKLVMSHLVSADEKDNPLNQQQQEKFAAIAQHFPNALKSLANSSGLFRGPAYHFDLGRPGMALYGLNPTPEAKNPMKNVVSLHTRILQIRHVKKGESIGYNATHHFKRPGLTATIGMGYADGFSRTHSGKAHVYWQGIACPVVGRVSMDLVTVDLSHLRESVPRAGDSLEILGVHQDADTLSKSAGTIGYEILTSLGRRYQRTYLPASRASAAALSS